MKYLLILFLLIPYYTAICQEKFTVELNYKSSNRDTIFVSVDNGIEEKKYFLSNNPLIITDYYVSNYVSIQLFHPRSDGKLPNYELGLFTNSPNSSVTVRLLPSGKPIIVNKKDLFLFEEMGSEELKKAAKKEFDNFWSFYNEYNSQFGKNDSITAKAFALNNAHNLKVADAIQSIEPSYYSFWTFRRQISNNPDVDRKVKENILLVKFDKFKDTYEYTHIKELVFGSQISIGEKINNFESFDILTNKKASLSSLGKPLLLMTWATWCSPCIKKINTIQELSKRHPDLNVLFINMDNNVDKAKLFINKRTIVGNHFSYLNQGIPTMFSNQLIPKIYLLDKELSVIYSFDLSSDIDLEILSKTLLTYFK